MRTTIRLATLVLCIAALGPKFGVAQPYDAEPTWVARYDSIAYGAPALLATGPADALYVVGTAQGTRPGFQLLRYTAAGGLEWTRRYRQSSGFGFGGVATALAVDDAGYVYVAGFDEVQSIYDGFVTLKYAPDGSLCWVQTFSQERKDLRARAIALDDEGNVYVTGYGGGAMITVAYDHEGAVRWSLEEPGMQPHRDGNDWARLQFDVRGYLIVMGVLGAGGDFYRPLREVVVAKYATDGDRLWSNRLDNTDYSTGDARLSGGLGVDAQRNVYAVHTNPDDAIEIVKYNEDGFVLERGTFDLGDGEHDEVVDAAITPEGVVYVVSFSRFKMALTKVDAEGVLAWTGWYEGEDPSAVALHWPSSMDVDEAGNACMTGKSDGPNGMDYYTACYDVHGTLLFSDRYHHSFRDQALAALLDDRGNLYIAGTTEDDNVRALNTLKYAAAVPTSTEAEASPPPEPAFSLVALGPNPVASRTRFALTVPSAQRTSVEVYDLLGRKVFLLYDGVVPGHVSYEIVLDASGLPSGTYLCVARTATGTVSRAFHVVH